MTSDPQAVLLDTHTLLWTTEGRRFPGYNLSESAARVLVDSERAFVSLASLWEIAIKYALPGNRGLRLSLPYEEWIDAATQHGGFTLLPIQEAHLKRLATLSPYHGDPFDRLLVAQALVEGLPIVSADVALDAYGVERIW